MLRWVGSGTGMVAAVLVALNISSRVSGVGFVIFTLSSTCWIAAGLMDGNPPLALQNGILLLVNLVGIFRYLLPTAPRGNRSAESEA